MTPTPDFLAGWNAAIEACKNAARGLLVFDGTNDVKMGVEIAQGFIISSIERLTPPSVSGAGKSGKE